MYNKLPKLFIKFTRKFLYATSTKQKYRVSENDFTRDRKLPFHAVGLCMIKLLRQNIQVELNSYFYDNRELCSKPKTATSSAFVQARKKIKPQMFEDLNDLITTEFYHENDENIILYKGYRLMGIDGSSAGVPVNIQTKEHYGLVNNQLKTNDVVQGRVSILYDLLNEFVVEGKLYPYKMSEIPISREHFKAAGPGDIIIMDRGYPSFQSIYEMKERGIEFLFRCKKQFSNKVFEFSNSDRVDEIIEIQPGQKRSLFGLPFTKEDTIKVRMIKVKLSTGEDEILMTSLMDKKEFPQKEFKELYAKRWGIETFYNRFKNIIGVENFSGTSHQFIQQEFHCAIYMSNLQTILTKDAQKTANQLYKGRTYEYKINASLSLSFIRKRILELFLSEKDEDEILVALKELFVKNVIPIRPGRNFNRDHDKYRHRQKPKQSNNRRTTL